MPRALPQIATLYELDPDVSTVTEVFDPWRIDSITHSTRLPGGFFSLELTVAANQQQYWDWRESRMLYRFRLEESGGRVIWEGRLETVTLRGIFKVALRFVGYWSNFTDGFYNANFDTTGDVIIKAVRDTGLHADVDQLSTSNAQIETGPTIDQEYQDDWTCWQILTDQKRGVASFGSTNGFPMDIAVWDDRVVYYSERNPTAVTWQSFILPENGGGVISIPSRVSWQNLANAVTVTYEVSGTATRTTAVDQTSIDRFQRRERHIPSIGESVVGSGTLRSVLELAQRKDLQQETTGFEISRVWSTDGIEYPLCRVRAGDVIRIPDWSPRTGDLDTLTLDAFRTFMIKETVCAHDSGRLRIQPDREGISLGELLARNNIR